MATFEITSPDGKTWEVTAPDGASQDEVLAYAKGQWKAPQKTASVGLTPFEKLSTGMNDPIHGGAQLLTKMLPAGVVQAGNRANNWLADKTGMVAKLPEGGVDQQVRERESEYQDKRKAAGESGFDWWRLGGNVVSPANLALGVAAPVNAATLPGRMAAGAGIGSMSSLTAPVTEGDFWKEKSKQAAVGAIGGAVVPAAVAGAGRLISPKASVDPAIALLRQEGVKPTIGQTLGGAFNAAEEKFSSLPIMGDMIRTARSRADKDLRTAVANRALAPINEKLPKGLDGRDAVAYVGDALSDSYNALLPKMSAKADGTFLAEIASLKNMVNTGSIDPAASNAFNRILKNDFMGKFKGQNVLTGQTLKQVESDLTDRIALLSASTDADQRLVGNALKEARNSLRDLLQRNNPQFADELKAINSGYANFKRMQRASTALGAEDGAFNAANLQNAIKVGDRSKDKGQFAKGGALMQDLGDAAKSRLGNKIADSGTPGRLAMGVGALASGAISPYIPGGLAIGAAAYTPFIQSLLRGSVASRPALADPVARLFNQASPMLAPAGGLLGIDMLDQ